MRRSRLFSRGGRRSACVFCKDRPHALLNFIAQHEAGRHQYSKTALLTAVRPSALGAASAPPDRRRRLGVFGGHGATGAPVAAVPRRTGQRVVRGRPEKFCRIRRPARRADQPTQQPGRAPRRSDMLSRCARRAAGPQTGIHTVTASSQCDCSRVIAAESRGVQRPRERCRRGASTVSREGVALTASKPLPRRTVKLVGRSIFRQREGEPPRPVGAVYQ